MRQKKEVDDKQKTLVLQLNDVKRRIDEFTDLTRAVSVSGDIFSTFVTI